MFPRPVTREGHTPLFFLGGPTASGKTDLAHLLADRHGFSLLSLDSMMVYQGMDIGTAKPTQIEIKRHNYAGLDLVPPERRFSTGDWLDAVRGQLDDQPRIAVGGTGLYLMALVRGLASGAPVPASEKGVDARALRDEILTRDPGVLERMEDPWNPRRLARALDFLRAGKPLPDEWDCMPKPVLPVLDMPVAELDARIRGRAAGMLEGGLLEEAERLRKQHGNIPGTAAQAIGYREAYAVLEGTLSPDAAVTAITLRTRRYAKRQRTWFRNQIEPKWVEVGRGEPEAWARAVEKVWAETGPFYFNRRPSP